jgi:hypothetical protein
LATDAMTVPAPRSSQAIAGVVPSEVQESTIMVIWPSIAAFGLGRGLGKLYNSGAPFGHRVFKLGNLIALASIPIAIPLYFWKVLPWVGTRYRLTNRRVIIERGWAHVAEKWVHLDRFDRVEVDVRSGQAWYNAGDLIFLLNNVETFRLKGVSRPEGFRQNCLKAHQAYTTVRKAMAREKK